MKKNAIITIDETTARVTKAFQKQARIFGTPEYETRNKGTQGGWHTNVPPPLAISFHSKLIEFSFLLV